MGVKELIKQLLREEIISKLSEWEQNISNFGRVLSTLIWEDNENGDRLFLFVGFNQYGKSESYSYSFILLDKDNNPKTGYMTLRDEVAKYIPKDVKGNLQIFKIVLQLTRKLLNIMIPEEIIRKTVEPLSGDSLKRYEEITKIMVNEYGYVVTKTYKDEFGCTVWILNKNIGQENNVEMNETYNIGGIPSGYQILKDTFDWVLPLLPKRK